MGGMQGSTIMAAVSRPATYLSTWLQYSYLDSWLAAEVRP